MRHRGPDDEGLALIDPSSAVSQRLVTENSDAALRDGSRAGSVAELAHAVGFGHGRFSIIDPSPDGHQPFWSADGAVCAMFNGEIYNYVELRRELQGLGRRFRTASDTEVLVAAYQEWGTACFPRLNGFFALSLWDARRRQVLLARDRVGKAPLYVWRDGTGLFWASELKGLFALNPRAGERINVRTLVEFVELGLRDIGADTCYAGVTSFPRASLGWVEPDGSIRPEPYWSLPEGRFSRGQLSAADAAMQLAERLREAVGIRLRADVPVGVQLSGGLDSSTALALAAQQADRIDAFTVAFDDPAENEEPFARSAAGRYPSRVSHRVIRPPDQDLIEHADSYVHLMGEPFHSPNQFTSQRVWREMRKQGLRVVLYGAGGDEAFAGYAEEYQLPFLRHLLRAGEVRAWLRETLRSTDRAPASLLLDQARRLAGRLPASLRRRADPPHGRELFRPPVGVEPRPGPREDIAGLLVDNMTDWRMSYWVRIDNQNSMGVPIELRCPFLDHRVLELAFRLPLEYLIHDGWLKWILRRAMAAHLPPDVVWRRRKMGFPFPLRQWLGRRRGQLLSMLAGLDCPYLDAAGIEARYDDVGPQNPRRLWRVLSVALWWKRCVQGLPLVDGAAAVG
jgi:asparagine synthase (glutamine-hydrolysing)